MTYLTAGLTDSTPGSSNSFDRIYRVFVRTPALVRPLNYNLTDLLFIFVLGMRKFDLYKPVVFFGRRIYILFAAALSVPVWLAADTFMEDMSVHEEEAVATAVTICFFAGAFAGRHIALIWALHTRFASRKHIARLAGFIIACLVWLFVHADFPLDERAINLLLYWLPFMAMSLAIGILAKIVRSLSEKELNEARNLAAQSESELKLLQSQLSPHFLFNTLNNMYGLSITQHEKIPPLLLRLSDLLRHSVYGSNEMFVPLKSEIEYITNYIEFEKIRLSDRLILKTNIEVPSNEEVEIAPMLLIVFVENAFKHSKNTADSKIFVEISLKTWNNLVLFSVKNSHSKQEKKFDRNSGFGLGNVRKRLELLYPGEYRLDIEEDEHWHSVMLQVKMKNK